MSNKKDRAKKEGAVALLEKSEVVEADDVPADLTAMQWKFVLAMTDGPTVGNGTKSAIAAGYSEKTSGSICVALLRLPHVSAAIDARLREAIGGPLAAKAVDYLRRVLDDKDASPKLRTDIALKLVEFSGIIERTKAQKAKETGLGADKVLTEYTRTELEDIVRKGAAVLQAAASLPGPGQAIDGRILPLNVHDSVPEDAE